jgi:hypothetical protein
MAGLNTPVWEAIDTAGNLFILEGWNIRARRVDVETHIITTVAGGGTSRSYNGPATNMDLGDSRGIAISGTNLVFIANSNKVLKVDLATGLLTIFAGTGEFEHWSRGRRRR